MAKLLLSERAIVPSFCLEGRDHNIFDSLDFKRDKNLVLYFVSEVENGFLVSLEGIQSSLRSANAETAVITALPVFIIEDFYKKHRLSFSILSDNDRAVLGKFIKTDPFETFAAMVITNKKGELFFQTVVSKAGDLPPGADIVRTLQFVDTQ